jgi:hypothetical protein
VLADSSHEGSPSQGEHLRRMLRYSMHQAKQSQIWLTPHHCLYNCLGRGASNYFSSTGFRNLWILLNMVACDVGGRQPAMASHIHKKTANECPMPKLNRNMLSKPREKVCAIMASKPHILCTSFRKHLMHQQAFQRCRHCGKRSDAGKPPRQTSRRLRFKL